MRKLIPAVSGIILALAVVVTTTACASRPVGPGPDAIKVLFIGSSYFAGNDLIGMFHSLADEGGKDIWIGEEVISGKFLDYHALSSSTDKRIRNQDWDFVLMQGGGTPVAYPQTAHLVIPPYEYHNAYAALDLLVRKIWANHPGSRPVFMMPWAFEDGLLWVDGQSDTYADMQELIFEHSVAWGQALDLTIAPVGWAFNSVLAERPYEHYLHVSDWNHASLKGSYLAACVFYVTLFQEGVAGFSFSAGLSRQDALYFQQVATATVLENTTLWNLGDIPPEQ
ncbi:hypothetical protein ACFL3H_10120 [Gemmatimonadota bacterium]